MSIEMLIFKLLHIKTLPNYEELLKKYEMEVRSRLIKLQMIYKYKSSGIVYNYLSYKRLY